MRKKEAIVDCGCKVHIAKSQLNKTHSKCSHCGGIFCLKHIYLKYVDESNHSITKYAPLVCKQCYEKLNGVK